MAKSAAMGKFYLFLGAVAVIGAVGIWMARSGDGEAMSQPVSLANLDPSFEGYVIGSDSAPVEVIEFSDFECPFCAQFAVLTMPDVHRRLIATGKVRWRFRDFPLNTHRYAATAHHAAACAAEQDKFWEMHDQLFFNQSDWSRRGRVERKFRDYAEQIGVNVDQYEDCMDEGRYRAQVQSGVEEGLALGVNSTPTFIIGNRRYPGSLPFDVLNALVDSIITERGGS